MNSRRRSHRILLGLVALCLFVRLGVLAWAPADYARNPMDIDGWGSTARHLADGRGLVAEGTLRPTAERGPVYPAFLAGVYLVADAAGPGPAAWLPLAAQGLLDTFSCWLVYLLARRTACPRRAALAAAALWALYVPEATLVKRLWSEPLFAVVLLAAMLVTRWATRKGAARWLAAGAAWGLSSLCRPAGLVIGLAVAIWAFADTRIRSGRRASVLMAAGMALALSPWVVRNALRFRAFIPLTTHGGFSLWESACNLGDERFWWRQASSEEAVQRLRAARGDPWPDLSMTETERDRVYRRYGVRRVAEHPLQYLATCLLRLLRTTFNIGYGGPPSASSWLVAGFHALLLVMAGLGLARAEPAARARLALLWVVPAANLALHTVLVGFVRYAFPVMGPVMILAALGLFSLRPGRPAAAAKEAVA